MLVSWFAQVDKLQSNLKILEAQKVAEVTDLKSAIQELTTELNKRKTAEHNLAALESSRVLRV